MAIHFSDSVALTALAFAVCAFLAAFFQVLLQYLTSLVRDKCLSGAIGDWAKYTSTRWSFYYWQLQVEYAKLDLDIEEILRVDRPKLFERQDVEDRLTSGLLLPGSRWVDVSKAGKNLTWFQIWYRDKALIVQDGDEPYRTATFNELTWKGKCMWVWFVLWTPGRRSRKVTMAKAGWSNMLTCTDVPATPDLIKSKDRADVIPHNLDFPWQTIKISDLGVWCFILGFKDVKVDPVKGDFTARSNLGSIATNHTVVGIGKMVTAEVEFELLLEQATQTTSWEEKRHVALNAKGHIRAGIFSIRPTSFDLKSIVRGLQENWTGKDWETSERYRKKSGSVDETCNLLFQASEWQRFNTDDDTSWERFRQGHDPTWGDFFHGKSGYRSPSMTIALAFLPFMAIWGGFPRRLMTDPFDPYIDMKRLKWCQESTKDFKSSLHVDSALRTGKIDFLRHDSDFVLAHNKGPHFHAMRSWLFHPHEDLLRSWDNGITDLICDVDEPVPVPSIIEQLITGVCSEERVGFFRRKLAEQNFSSRSTGSNDGHTIEAALWLTLVCIDTRIQKWWIPCDDEASPLKRLKPEVDPTISAELGDFLGLFLEVCKDVDICSSRCEVEALFDKVLDSWKDSTKLAIQEEDNPSYDPDIPENSAANPRIPGRPMTRSQFYKWACEACENGDERRKRLRRMMPLLQLRIWCMNLMVRMYGDSSSTYLAAHSPNPVYVRLL